MRTLEIRRHCFTKKGDDRGKGSQLSAIGVTQARQIGNQIGPFARVLTSHIPRTIETALAMGFAVDDQLERLGDIPPAVWEEIGHQERWTWDDPFGRFAQIIQQQGPTAQMGTQQQAIWTQAVEAVPLNSQVLIISHGRVIEAGLVTCFPNADFSCWGHPFHHGEGIQLTYDNGQFTLAAFRRND